jgi:hypothetical protein
MRRTDILWTADAIFPVKEGLDRRNVSTAHKAVYGREAAAFQ